MEIIFPDSLIEPVNDFAPTCLWTAPVPDYPADFPAGYQPCQPGLRLVQGLGV